MFPSYHPHRGCTAALCFILAAAPLAAAVLTPHDVARIRTVTDAHVSPDGSEIAYLLAVPRQPGVDDDGPSFIELHLVNAAGESRPYITGHVTLSSLAWTPDGRGISYLAKRNDDEHKSLYVIPLSGGESQKRLGHKTDIQSYSWSPDGTRVAFVASKPEAEGLEKQKKHGFSQQIYEEDSPNVPVWIATLPEHAGTEIEPRLLDLPGSASAAKWSPDGTRLAVVIAPTPSVDDSYMRQRVQLVDVETGKVSAILDHSAKLGDFDWSPDSKRLFTISGEDINDPRDGRLLVWESTGGKPRPFLLDYEGHVSAAAWKDNDSILFVGGEGVWTALRELNANDGSSVVRQKTGNPILRSISLSRDGSVAALTADTVSHPREVFRLAPAREEVVRLTRSNPWLDEFRLAPQEPARYRARDGLAIEGVLVRPLNETPGTRSPLILAVHGGPESHISQGWITSYSMPGQVAAAEGMAVFYPNYRGSTGRGVAFSKLGQADAAGPEFTDLIDAIDHFVETGLADAKKIGITGGSYGGYASAWGATYYSDRYAASVMFVGISDNISKLGTTDIPDEMYYVHHRKRLWEDWDYFLQRSPIRHVEKARTPLLILHGKEDPRVHPSQSLELHRHIKTLGQAPVRLVLYPGEGHGNRRAASRLDYNLRLMRWMKHYLIGPGGNPPPYELDYGLEDKETNAAGQ